MRSLLLITLAFLLPVSVAWPCAQRPPMRNELSLVTAADTTIPGDGAILVTRHEVPTRGRDGDADFDERWTVKDGEGHDVALTVEILGGGVERWQPKVPADRDLVILDEAGKEIAKLHQTKAKSRALAAPRAKSAKSTTLMEDRRKMMSGVPGGTTTVELGQDPPADARFLAIAVTGSGAFAHSALAPTPGSRTLEWTTHTHKTCAGGGVESLVVGQHIALAWIDGLGRRSAPAALTVGQRPQPTK